LYSQKEKQHTSHLELMAEQHFCKESQRFSLAHGVMASTHLELSSVYKSYRQVFVFHPLAKCF
jgi:hypothetical protein